MRVGAVHLRGGMMIRIPWWRLPRMEPPLASTIKLTRNLWKERSDAITNRSQLQLGRAFETQGKCMEKGSWCDFSNTTLEATTVGSHQTCMELTLRVKTERQLGFHGRKLPPRRQGNHHGHNTTAQRRNRNILQVGIEMIYERNTD